MDTADTPAQATSPEADARIAAPAEGPAAPETALDAAEKAARRARKTAQLRLGFIGRTGSAEPVPPLSRMLRGGRGGQVRLKLFLSFLWMQTDGARAVPLAYPAQLWAALLGLTDPQRAGARRINEAIRWLETNQFITVQAQPGHSNCITVLNETGDGTPYTPPGRAANLLRDDREQAARHFYVQLPAALWTNGYMAALSGAGLAFLLALMDQYGPGEITDPGPVWFSPKLFKTRYALSDDTRAKGMNDLHTLGLISIARQPVNPNDFDIERVRNTYTLHPAVLQEPARRRPPTRVATAGDWVNQRLIERILGASTEDEVFTAAHETADTPQSTDS